MSDCSSAPLPLASAYGQHSSRSPGRHSGTPVAHLRGLGAMIGFDILKARGRNEPDGPLVKRILATALKRGLLCISCGAQGETIRLLVPLTIADADLDKGLGILVSARDGAGLSRNTTSLAADALAVTTGHHQRLPGHLVQPGPRAASVDATRATRPNDR